LRERSGKNVKVFRGEEESVKNKDTNLQGFCLERKSEPRSLGHFWGGYGHHDGQTIRKGTAEFARVLPRNAPKKKDWSGKEI